VKWSGVQVRSLDERFELPEQAVARSVFWNHWQEPISPVLTEVVSPIFIPIGLLNLLLGPSFFVGSRRLGYLRLCSEHDLQRNLSGAFFGTA